MNSVLQAARGPSILTAWYVPLAPVPPGPVLQDTRVGILPGTDAIGAQVETSQ